MIKVLRSVVVGPLEPYAAGFAGELERQGYSAGVAAKQVGMDADLRRWVDGEDVRRAGLLVMRATGRCVRSRLCWGTCAGWASSRCRMPRPRRRRRRSC